MSQRLDMGQTVVALDDTRLIDRNEVDMRRFLIWAALLATSTLRKISVRPLYSTDSEVKVSRRRVAAIVAPTKYNDPQLFRAHSTLQRQRLRAAEQSIAGHLSAA